MFFRNSLASVAVAALSAGAFSLAVAQSPPTTSGSLAPAGQGPGAMTSSPEGAGMSTKSRASVKAETRRAQARGTLQPAGEAPAPIGGATSSGANADKSMTSHKSTHRSTRHRAAVKRQTKAAEMNGTLQPAGEATQPSSEPPKK